MSLVMIMQNMASRFTGSPGFGSLNWIDYNKEKTMWASCNCLILDIFFLHNVWGDFS